MAPTGAVEAMESLVFGFVTIAGISFRLLSTTDGKFNVFSLKVDGFVCRKRLLCDVEKESTSWPRRSAVNKRNAAVILMLVFCIEKENVER